MFGLSTPVLKQEQPVTSKVVPGMPDRCFLNKIVLTVGLAICFLSMSSGWAFSFQDSYIPPEVAYAEDLRQQVHVSGNLNLNTMNLGELKILPGVSEDIALKIMRQRPFTDVQDFYRKMPSVNHKQLQLFIQQWQPHFK